MSLRVVVRFLLSTVVFFAGVVHGHGEERRERRTNFVPPPPPVPLDVKAQRGQDLSIPLRTYGRQNPTNTFVIRKPPISGTLLGMQLLPGNVTVVIYRPPKDRAITRDSFEYAAKSTEGVSAAVPVEIEIVDKPADLSGPTEVRFGERLVGQMETQTLEFVNRGGMTAEGVIELAAPWRLESPESYRIDPGGRLFLKVTFAPMKAGDFIGELRLGSQLDRPVVLYGTGRDGLGVNPSTLKLIADPTTLVRSGVFEIINRTEAAQAVTIEKSERLVGVSTVSIAPGQTAQLSIAMKPDDAAALNTGLELKAGDLQARLTVTADALPGIIRANERSIDFGMVANGGFAAHELELRNVGGAPAWLRAEAAAPLRVDGSRRELGPGEKVTLSVVLNPVDVGMVDQAVTIQTSNGVVTVPVRATIVSAGTLASQQAALSRNAKRTLGGDRAESEARPPTEVSPHELQFDGAIDPRKIVRTVAVSATGCTLEWHVELSPAREFVAEQRELVFEGGTFSVRWSRLPQFTVETMGERVRATIAKLEPGKRYTVRILPVVHGGETGLVLAQSTFKTTPPPRAEPWRFSWVGLLGTLAVALGAFALWQRGRALVGTRPALNKTQRIY